MVPFGFSDSYPLHKM